MRAGTGGAVVGSSATPMLWRAAKMASPMAVPPLVCSWAMAVLTWA